MATQNINIVISSTGGVTVVRNLQSIAASATAAVAPLKLMERTLHSVMAVMGVQKIMEWADAWTAATNKVNVFAKSQEETNVVIERLYQIAQNVRQPLNEMVALYHRLSIGAKELGVSSNQNLKFTELVGKALAVQGTSANQARGALTQLSQAMGMGRVRAQEWNSMIENLPLLLVTAAKNIDGMGGSVSKLRKMMLDGKLSSKIFYDAIMKGDADLSAMHEKTNKTFSQGMTIMNNALIKYVGGLNQSLGASNKFFSLMEFLGKNLDTIGNGLGVVAVGVAAAFAPALITGFASALGLAAVALGRVSMLLLANPFAIVALAVASVYAFGDAWLAGLDNITTVKDLLVAVGQIVSETFDDITGVLGGMWTTIANTAQQAYEYMTGAVTGATGEWAGAYGVFFENVGTGFAGLLRRVAIVMDGVTGLLTGMMIGMERALRGLPDIFVNVFKQAYNSTAYWVEKVLGVVVTGINAIRSKLGMDLLATMKFEQLKVDANVFKKYGETIGQSINAGFDAQGGYMQKKVEALFGRAQGIAAKRAAQTPAGSGVNLDEFSVNSNAGAAGKKSRTKKVVDEYGDLIKSIEQKTAASKLEESQDRSLTEGQKFALTIMEKIRTSTLKLSDAQKIMLGTKLEEMLVSEQLTATRMAELKATEQANKERQTTIDKLKEQATSVEEELRQQLDKNASIGMSKEAIAQLTAQRDLDTASVMESMAIRQLDKNLDYEKYDATMKVVTGMRALAAARAEGGRKQLAFETADKANAEWTKFYDSLYNGLTDSLYRAFEQGQNFFQSFWSGIKNTFKTTVLKMAIQGVVGGVAGMLGLPSPSGGVGGMLGAAGSAASSMGGLMNNPLLNMLGRALPSAITGGLSAGFGGLMGSIGSLFGATGTGATLGGAMSAGSIAMGAGNIAGGLATFAGALGPIALGVGALYSMLKSKPDSRYGGTYGYQAGGSAQYIHGPQRGNTGEQGVRDAINSTVGTINTIFKAVGSSSNLASYHAGLETSNKGRGGVMAGGYLNNGRMFGESGQGSNYNGTYYERNSTQSPDSATASANFALDLKQSIIQAMQAASDIPETIMRNIRNVDAESLSSEAISQLLGVIDAQIAAVQGFKAALQMLPFEKLKNLSFDAAANMITAAGGLDNLSKMLDSYYQNFTTAEEKRTDVINRMVGTLNKNGVNVTGQAFEQGGALSTRAQFKALVERTDVSSDLYIALLGMNEAFASITPEAIKATNALSEIGKQLESEAKQLQIEMMRATGRNASADAAQRAFDTAGYTEAEMALYDYNTTLRKRIDLYKQEQDALADTVSKFRGYATDLRSFRDSLSLSSLSPLTPGQRYTESQSQFEAIARQTESGTPAQRAEAMGKLQGASQAMLEASRVVNASGGGYITDFNRVQDVLSRAAISAGATADVAQVQVDIARTQLIQLGDIAAGVAAMDGSLRTYLGGQARYDDQFISLTPGNGPPTQYFTAKGDAGAPVASDQAVVAELQLLRKALEELKAQQPALTGAIITGNRTASMEAANVVVNGQSRADYTSNAPALT